MTTSSSRRPLTAADFKVPALLLLLSFVPMIGGVVRVLSVARDVTFTTDNARFLHAPLPVLIHIACVTPYCLLGAFQFSSAFRARWPGAHRKLGRLLAVCGLVSGATGIWMTVFYAIPTPMQGGLLYAVRVIVGVAMVASIVVAWSSILRRDVARHEAFMIRAYALGQGAGTQALVLGPWMLITGEGTGLTRDLLMALTWVINAAVAEWIVRQRTSASRKRALAYQAPARA